MSEKLITVITTVYNKAPFLKTWAESVASQTYLDKARILVIDDGSTDDSVALIQKYADEYGISGELYLHEENQGLLRTILDAYHLLDTKYFTVLDADDYWTSPQKLEKAVKFLEAHEDFSCYFSNYLCEKVSEENIYGFPQEISSCIFSAIGEIPKNIHTSSSVFRNFFTPELLDEMELASRGKIVHACETDPFRNFLAAHFGKFYFENAVDAVWRANVGVLGKSSKIESYSNIMQEHWQIFDFNRKFFDVDENALCALNRCLIFYNRLIDFSAELLKTCTLFDFRGGKYFRDRFFDYGDSDAEKIINALLEQAKFFKQIGLRIDGDKVTMNFEAGTT